MAEKIQPQGPSPRAPSHGPMPSAPDQAGGHPAGHETDDLNVRAVFWFIGSLIGGSFILWLVLAGYWHELDKSIRPGAKTSPWVGQRQLPPAPRLQVQGNIDLQSYLDDQGKRLNSYGEQAPGTGNFYIPIEKAMDLVVQQGLPARPAQPAAEASKQALKGNERNPNDPRAQ